MKMDRNLTRIKKPKIRNIDTGLFLWTPDNLLFIQYIYYLYDNI